MAGQVKLGMHAMRLCQMRGSSDSNDDIGRSNLVSLLRLLESRMAFNNVFLRHYLFCILQIFAGRLVHENCLMLFFPKIQCVPSFRNDIKDRFLILVSSFVLYFLIALSIRI